MENQSEDQVDDQIRSMLAVDEQPDGEQRSGLDRVMRRVRAGVGQRDSMLFAFVKFWTVIAEMMAPIFARIAERQAQHQHTPKD
ncbi:MAG: hypothetical protein AAGA84_10080 [Pseudomonadota bacterium]